MGAGDALRERSAVALPASSAADRAQRTELARQKLRGAFESHYAEGRMLSMDEVVRLATDSSVVHTSEFRIPAAADVAPAAKQEHRGLRVLALGQLQVFVDGQPIETAAWGSARPRELLVYLLMHPEGRTKEQVGLAFWPDASAAQMRNNFHVTLHRLRKALGGSSWVALENDRYRIPQELIDIVDVHAFEREVTEARKELLHAREARTAAARLEKAIELYRGDFLDGEPVGDWHVDHRDRYQRICVGALMELGGRFAEDGRHAKAAEAFRRVLARDELNEEALRALIRSLAETGERSQALRTYERFVTKLRSELEADPESETVELVSGIRA
jgi:DNA-binding SARP family transcriptional activator